MLKKKADISVILPVYNGEKYLKECIESIINQSILPKEILIIDDGSTDNSSTIYHKYPQLTYHKITNKGVANARNEGLKMAKYGLIAFIDQDDTWSFTSLETRLNALKKANNTKIVVGKQDWFLDGLESRPSWVKEEQMENSLDGYLLGCALIHKDLFEIYDTFDDSFRFASDFDWFFRLKDASENFIQVDDIVLNKRIHALNESRHAKESLTELTKALYKSILRKKQRN